MVSFKELKQKVWSRFENSSVNSGLLMVIMMSIFGIVYLLFRKKSAAK